MKTRSRLSDRWEAMEPWVYDNSTGCLVFPENGYEVPLIEMNSSARTLDWIIQVSKKIWADDAVIAGLVVGIDRYLDLQANMCSVGVSKTLSDDEIKASLGLPN